METQPNQLRAVQPSNRVDGFDIEVIRHDHNLIEGQEAAQYFCNRFVQINAWCDGSNPQYPQKTTLTLLVTQYSSENESLGIRTQKDVGVIILKNTESLTAVGVFEIRQNDTYTTVLILWIKDSQHKSTSTAAYELAQKRQYRH